MKFYLREGLLPPGEPVSATRARYGEDHVDRLRLVRALVQVGGLGLDRVRAVLAVRSSDATLAASIGAAHYALASPPEASAAARARVTALVEDLGWTCDLEQTHARALAAALDGLDRAGQPMAETVVREYAEAAARVARADLGSLGERTGAQAVTYAVIGTVLSEPVLVALRRMAQEDRSRRGAAEQDGARHR
ncbi:MerR family transcriptional regulator [Nocardioides sp. HDW12B]|uniref:MerR family transcriptional regulator n=1 Tax=Nocardioides sp. HDW12B TaxID=2714939 RepID=UPI001408235C|nr:MerR family transcriptional regulator [Nocardioides sp. HDW12B]QIK65502.1 MerR family transcriptional regulator [Nocardioides sp. HDW12B]